MSNNWTITRATLEESDDAKGQQMLRARGHAGETFSNIVRAQSYGITSNAPAGSDALMLRLGSSERIMMLGVEDPGKRPKGMPPGVSAIYGPDGEIASLVERSYRVKTMDRAVIKVGNALFRITPTGIACNVPITAPSFAVGTPPLLPTDEVTQS
jgi:phage gp45-like